MDMKRDSQLPRCLRDFNSTRNIEKKVKYKMLINLKQETRVTKY